MKRRGFLKFLGVAAATPVVAPLAAKSMRAEPTPETITKQLTNVRDNYSFTTACIVTGPPFDANVYARMSEAGEMPRYEGMVYGPNGNAIWRFDKVSGIHFQCHNCGAAMTFNREDFRVHGKTCNADLIAPMERA